MKKQANNPTGKNGKPITLAPMSFEEAVKKMLETQPPPPSEPREVKPQKKAPKK